MKSKHTKGQRIIRFYTNSGQYKGWIRYTHQKNYGEVKSWLQSGNVILTESKCLRQVSDIKKYLIQH